MHLIVERLAAAEGEEEAAAVHQRHVQELPQLHDLRQQRLRHTSHAYSKARRCRLPACTLRCIVCTQVHRLLASLPQTCTRSRQVKRSHVGGVALACGAALALRRCLQQRRQPSHSRQPMAAKEDGTSTVGASAHASSPVARKPGSGSAAPRAGWTRLGDSAGGGGLTAGKPPGDTRDSGRCCGLAEPCESTRSGRCQTACMVNVRLAHWQLCNGALMWPSGEPSTRFNELVNNATSSSGCWTRLGFTGYERSYHSLGVWSRLRGERTN